MEIVDTNDRALELLSDFKWGEEFRCRKCGHDNYKKGKQPFARRCTNRECDYEESVFKYTAFEGLKLAPEKIYLIVEYLVDSCRIDRDAKTIIYTKHGKEEGEILSINELADMYEKGEVSPEKADRLFAQNLNDHRIIVSEIAERFQTEENTVYNILDRFSTRLSMIYTNEYNQQSTDYLFGILREDLHDLNYYLGLLMFPTDRKWVEGVTEVNDRKYKLCAPRKWLNPTGRVRWYISELFQGDKIDTE